MATLPTTAIGTNISVSGGATLVNPPVFELISGAVDGSYLGDSTNSDHTSEGIFNINDMPTDFLTMTTLSIRLRYKWSAYATSKLWSTLTAQITDSSSVALTNEVTVASSITATTGTNSAVVAFTGLNTTAGKTTWNGARLVVRITLDRVGGGNTNEAQVTAGELTGTYESGVLIQTDAASVAVSASTTAPYIPPPVVANTTAATVVSVAAITSSIPPIFISPGAATLVVSAATSSTAGPPGAGRLTWNAAGTRRFETGLDRGVLYVNGVGVPWNGLVSVDINSVNNATPLYFNGVKTMDLITFGNVSGTIKAFTYPEEFLEFEGNQEDATGLIIHDQPVGYFGLCYRTKIGNDVDQKEYGYKIHVLYNLTVIPNTVSISSINDRVAPSLFDWSFSSVPEAVDAARATTYVIFDSTKMFPEILQQVEDLLYGTESTASGLPDITTLLTAGRSLEIVDNGNGTWTATGVDDLITMTDSITFEIEASKAVYLDNNTYTITSS